MGVRFLVHFNGSVSSIEWEVRYIRGVGVTDVIGVRRDIYTVLTEER